MSRLHGDVRLGAQLYRGSVVLAAVAQLQASTRRAGWRAVTTAAGRVARVVTPGTASENSLLLVYMHTLCELHLKLKSNTCSWCCNNT